MPTNETTYIFEVKLAHAKRIKRRIEIAQSDTLDLLAHAITQSYDFDMDHCYGFYDHVNRHGSTKKAAYRFELFSDLDMETLEDTHGVEDTHIYQLWNYTGSTWYFLYDYGDCWVFMVTLKGTDTKKDAISYPHILSSKGAAPEQYPNWDDEDECQEQSL